MKNAMMTRKKELHKRREFLRKGKHARNNMEVLHRADNILYHQWDEELDHDIQALREKDRTLIEHILEVTNIYNKVDEDEVSVYPNRPPRPCICDVYPCLHTLVIM